MEVHSWRTARVCSRSLRPSASLGEPIHCFYGAPHRRRQQGRAAPVRALDVLVEMSLVPPPICFDKACAAQADRAFLLAICVPVAVAGMWIAYLLRPPPKDRHEDGTLFEDPATGFFFKAVDGAVPERDRNGELAFRPISFTPWPVDAAYEGERVRIPVGPVGALQLRTFVFQKALPQPSDIVLATLPRPLGLVLEFDEARRRVVVAGLVEGSAAEQRRRRASVDPQLCASTAQEGDVLRALTCTNIVYPTNALFGLKPAQRHIVVYGLEAPGSPKQRWGPVKAALRKGDARDGTVTLVLERPAQQQHGHRS